MTSKRIFTLVCTALLACSFVSGASAQSKKKSSKNKQKAKAKETSFSFKGSKKLLFKSTPQGKLHIHVFKPDGWKASDLRPAIIFFFGGGWNGGSPGQFEQHCKYLASRGMVAITSEYRVKSRHKTLPYDCVKDGKSAIRWVREHSGELGIDPNRLAAGGGSAGGHVAASTATTTTIEEENEDLSVSSVPDALALFNPVYNNGPGQWGHDRVKERWREISPAHNIRKGMSPAIVFFGSKDALVTVKTAAEFQSAMRKIGSKSELKITEGAGHGYFNFGRDGNKAFIQTVTEMDEFFVELGWLMGAASVADFVAGK